MEAEEDGPSFEMIMMRGGPPVPPTILAPYAAPNGCTDPRLSPQERIDKVFLVFCTNPISRTSIWRTWFKQIISYKSGGINHVEPVFQLADGRLYACSCTGDFPVYMAERDAVQSYNATRWRCYEIQLLPAEKQRMWQFCLAQCGKPYNWRAIYYNFVSLLYCCCGTREDDHSSWFCSHLIVATLQFARPNGEFAPYVGSRTNIGELKQIVERHRCFSVIADVMGDASKYPMRWIV